MRSTSRRIRRAPDGPGFRKQDERLGARFDAFDAKLDAFRADIKAEVKSSQMQNLLWLAGIMLVSNGMVIAVLAPQSCTEPECPGSRLGRPHTGRSLRAKIPVRRQLLRQTGSGNNATRYCFGAKSK